MSLQGPSSRPRPGDDLVIVHDFDARGPDELTLRRGERIQLMELDDDFGDGWYLGRALKTGTTGLFPGVYTTAAPKVHVPPQTDAPEAVPMRVAPTNGGAAPPLTDAPLTDSPVSSAETADTTPQASRHPSASHIQPPDTLLPTDTPAQQRSSSSPFPTSSMAADIHPSVRQSIDSHLKGQESPVMNETLSVIDEHITDLSTPRHSVALPGSKVVTDSGSEYSSHVDHRMSYINGNETDEEEGNQPSEDEVRRWNHVETARRLRDDLGVEAKHSEIFEEQEISGDVLLDMNQDFVFMKEFDFGVMGRRLKTWHKIKAFQENVKGMKRPLRGSVSGFSGPTDERRPSRTGNPGTFLPRIPSLSEGRVAGLQQARASAGSMQHPRPSRTSMYSNASSPRTPQTPTHGMDSQRRPSAASIRELNHSRRHSSIDTATRPIGPSERSPHTYHRKHASFDKTWSMAGANQRLASLPGTSLGITADGLPPHISRGAEANEADSGISLGGQYDDLDRGYVSGPERDPRNPRKPKRVLMKRSTNGAHSREASHDDEQLKAVPMGKRHSRFDSADSIPDPPGQVSADAEAYDGSSKGRFRSLSSRGPDRPGPTSNGPAVPGKQDTPGGGFLASFAPFAVKTDPGSSARSSPVPLQQIKNAGPKFRRAMGFRARTDIVGRGFDAAVGSSSPSKDSDPQSARTGSTTPSATSKSSERHSTDGSGRAAEGVTSAPRPRASTKSGTKSKKSTSAYTRGLERKPPHEQIKDCDYSGWMKKRSSNLMTTWKPRLFVLRGRRLSYYYSEQDTEERGLIDITAHRVLRADNDPIITLHATITGAMVSPTTPSNSAEPLSPGKVSTADAREKKEGDGPFFFKLVPPKMGASRTVQFTKPAIHYFQVDNVKQGRLWMAELMKATIDRNMDLPIEMTNKQKTISLKQARATNQRPPALMDTEPKTDEEKPKDSPSEARSVEARSIEERSIEERPREEADGLMIQGLNADRGSDGSEPTKEDTTEPGALDVDTGPSSLFPELLAESINR